MYAMKNLTEASVFTNQFGGNVFMIIEGIPTLSKWSAFCTVDYLSHCQEECTFLTIILRNSTILWVKQPVYWNDHFGNIGIIKHSWVNESLLDFVMEGFFFVSQSPFFMLVFLRTVGTASKQDIWLIAEFHFQLAFAWNLGFVCEWANRNREHCDRATWKSGWIFSEW